MTEEITIRQTTEETTSAIPAGQEASTMGARYGAERKERKPMVSWAALLDEAVKKPGFIHEAYTRFHNYSLGNQLLVLYQCVERALPLGPLASFIKWKELGRHVKKGEKAPTLCMPVTCKRTSTVKKDDGIEKNEQTTFTQFIYRNHCYHRLEGSASGALKTRRKSM